MSPRSLYQEGISGERRSTEIANDNSSNLHGHEFESSSWNHMQNTDVLS